MYTALCVYAGYFNADDIWVLRKTSSRDNERYAVLSELPIPPDMPSDVLAPIIIPAPFTIHDFLGTITGVSSDLLPSPSSLLKIY